MIKSFVRAGSWVVLSNVASKVLNFITLNFLARVLNPVGFGTYSALLTSVASINQICDIGTTVVLQRTGARIKELNPEKAGHRFGIILFIQTFLNLIFSVAIYFFPGFFSSFVLQSSGQTDSIQLIGIVAVFQVLSQVPLTFIMGLGEFRKYAFRMILANCITVLVTAVLIWIFGAELDNAIKALIVSLVLNTFLSWAILQNILNKYGIKLGIKGLYFETKSILKEGFVYYLGNIMAGAIMNIVLISLFARHIGLVEFGYVRIAGALIAIISIIPNALQSVTITFLALKEINGDQIKSIQLRYISVLSFFVSVILLFFLDFITATLFGHEYLAGRLIFIFIIVSNLMVVVSSLITNFLVSKGHASYVGAISTVGVILYTLLAFVLIPIIGIYGYFIGHLAGYGIGFILGLRKEFRNYHYPDLIHLKKLGIILLIGLAGLLPVYFLQSASLILFYKITYLLIMAFTALPSMMYPLEKTKMIQLFQSIRKVGADRT